MARAHGLLQGKAFCDLHYPENSLEISQAAGQEAPLIDGDSANPACFPQLKHNLSKWRLLPL